MRHQSNIVRIVPAPEPAYYYKGRPVYTEEQLATMDSPYPSEAEHMAEIMKRKRETTSDAAKNS